MKNYYPPLEENCLYHIYNRGNNREKIFFQHRNYDFFLRKYQQYLGTFLDTFTYCLLPNHFHLLVRVRPAESFGELPIAIENETTVPKLLSSQFRHFFNAYAKSINKQENRVGSLFQKNFKRILLEDGAYPRSLALYIHANPQSHGYTHDFRNYPYSSYNKLLGPGADFLQKQIVNDWFGSREQFLLEHENLYYQKNLETGLIKSLMMA